MICASCGARNAANAAWCSQCYEPVSPAATSQQAVRDPGVVPTSAARDVRERAGEVEWRCGACEGWNPLPVPSCGSCGAPRRGFGGRDEAAPPPQDATVLVGASLLLPGLGHLVAGRTGSGLARATLAVLWLGGGLLLVLGGAGTTATGWILLLGAAVLWVATVEDARHLASGAERELLGARRLAVLVAVVTGALLLGTVITALRLR